MKFNENIVIVMPAYNAEKTLAKTYADIPKKYIGYNCLKLSMKYLDDKLTFELNNPSVVYIAYIESYTDPTPADFEETGELMNMNLIPEQPRQAWKETIYESKATVTLKIKKKVRKNIIKKK